MQAGLPVESYGQDFLQTLDIGGSRFPLWGSSAFNPVGMVGVTTPTTLATLSVPPTYSTMGGGSPYSGGASASGLASSSPWSPSASPLPWVLIALIFGIWALHKLYWERK